MNKYVYEVTLRVEVEAFDDSDAVDALMDVFGVGEDLGVTVTECEYKISRAKKR